MSLKGKKGESRWFGSSRVFHVLLIAVALLISTGCGKKKPPPSGPPEVRVTKVMPQDVPIYKEWTGTLDGSVNAQIHAQVSGYLKTQDYSEGGIVKEGDLLFEIDPRPYQANLDQAKARLAQDQAQLGRTELDVKRYTPLAKINAVSQQELDNAVQANLAAEAQIKADEAAVEAANLNLEFTKITSPVTGLAGVAQAQIGDLVGPNSPELTTVSTIDPIKANVYVSEQDYLSYRQRHPDPAERLEHEQALELTLILADGSIYPLRGKFSYVGREVSLTTGTLRLTGLFPNPDATLRPGQFARVRTQTQIRKGALLVPARAIRELQGSHEVVVVDDQNVAHVRPVKTEDQVGSDWIVTGGLNAGERVIVEGAQNAKEGKKVNPQPFVVQGGTNQTH